MYIEELEGMTADEVSRWMVENSAEGVISRDEFMAAYHVYCDKKMKENENQVSPPRR